MKTITFPEDKADLFKKWLGGVIGAAPERGYSVSDIRTSLKILDAITEDSALVVLEDADYNFALSRVNEHRWPFAGKDIVEFTEHISSAGQAPTA